MRSKLVDSQQSVVDRKTMKDVAIKSIAQSFNRGKILVKSFVAKLGLLLAWMIAAPFSLLAQADTTQTHSVDMATTMRSNGKIYVVVAVLVIILTGLFLYLIRLDRKIGKLEKE